MKKVALTLLLGLVLAGCSAITTPFDDGYELGDTSKSVNEVRRDYCSEVTPLARLGLRHVLNKAGHAAPPDFCQ